MMSNLETTSLMPSALSTSTSGLLLPVQSQIRSSLIVAATGLGKTVLMGGLAKTWPKGRVMLISHRYEINQQAIDQLSNICGEEVDLEQASFEADQRTVPHRVVVASVQTLNSFRRKRQQYRMEKFDPMDFGLLLIDEAHRAAAVTYRRIIKHFLQNPECCVVGVTATPDRLDGIGMGNVFQVASSDLNALWGVENGWLVGPRQLFAKVDGLDLREVRTIGGDLDTSQLQRILELEKNLHEMAKPIVDVAGQDKQAIVFTASVKQAHSICEKIRDYHYREFGTETQAVALDGTLSPQDPKRKQIVKEFKAGDIQFLCNCGVACLDEQTEILTATGWVGIDDMSLEHQVAAWCPETEIIQFNKPLAVEVRDRRGDEQMVTLNTNRRSVRVTGDHRMAYMTGDCKTYRVSTAKEIVGRHVRIPVSGLSQPFSVGVDLEQVTEKTIKARVRSAAYVYRQQGISASSARALAEEGCRRRVDMVRKHVAELSMSELHLIGMWVGDGTVTRLKSGGVEYSIAQSLSYPNACNWIRSVISRSSIDHVEHSSRPGMLAGVNGNRMLKFSMPRGTGFGNQKRNGIYHIEQYLSKTNFRWLMGLSQEQLVWFIEGLWMADGEHGQCADPQRRSGARAKSWRIASANAELNDWLQAACACRNMVLRIAGGVVREGATRPLWTLNVASRTQHIATRHRFEIEQGWKQERVWCVKSTSGFIVTRRNGSVTITGNTEGFDAPNVRVIAIGRPTKSRALYQQMLGRGLRPLPGVVDNAATREERLEAIKSSIKPNCTVLDFVGQSGKHKLLCATDFMTGTDEPPEVKERANRLSGSGDFTGDQLDALREAREQLAKEREAARHKVTVGVNYQLLDTNSLYDLSQLPRVPGYMQRYQMSDKQKTMMLKLGYTEAQINKVKSKRGASVAIEHAINNPRTSFGMWMQRKKWEEARKGR